MQIIADPIRRCRKVVLSTAGIVAVAIASTCGLLGSTPTQAPPQQQNTTATPPAYECDVVSIKPYKPGSSEGNYAGGYDILPDGFSARNLFLKSLILTAYGVSSDQLLGVPDWLRTEGYDVEARMDEAVAGALQKLSPDDRAHARQQMLQALLADQ